MMLKKRRSSKRFHQKSLTKFVLVSSFLIFQSSSSYAILTTYSDPFLGSTYKTLLPPRILFRGTAGDNSFGEIDSMIPLFGNRNQFIHGDIVGKVGKHREWFGSVGGGIRKIVGETILGTYFFGDYNKSCHSNVFRVLNPGVELMTNYWDLHVNGYFPTSRKNYLTGLFSGTQLGIPNSVFFRHHGEYERVFDSIEEVGPGADFEIGYTSNLIKHPRFFIGGYHFSPRYSKSINGIEGGVEVQLNRWASIEFRNSYDRVRRNTAVVTFTIALGALDKTGPLEIQDRMLDRIPRHLGSLDNGNGIPTQKAIVDNGKSYLIKDNIWFFKPNPSGETTLVQNAQSCTFENPCVGLNQLQIDAINSLSPNANFYLASGTYLNPYYGGFNFYNGQNIFGRTSNYAFPATGWERPVLYDTLFLNGNNNVNGLRIVGNSSVMLPAMVAPVPFLGGINVPEIAYGPVNISNTDVFVFSMTDSTLGISNLSNNVTLNINNSNISSMNQDVMGGIAVGGANLGSGTINIANSVFNSTSNNVTNMGNLAFGVVNNMGGTINLINSMVSTQLINGDFTAVVLNNANGGERGTFNIFNSFLSGYGDNVNLVGGAVNNANNMSNIAGNMNILNSTIRVIGNNNSTAEVTGSANTGDGILSVSHSNIVAQGNGGNIRGFSNDNAGAVLNLDNSIISLNPSGSATSTPITNTGTFNDSGGNMCFQNGTPIPC